MASLLLALAGVCPLLAVAEAASSSKSTKLFDSASAYPAGQFPNHLAVNDFNGDGVEDIASANATGIVNVLLAKGDGSFSLPVAYPTGQLLEGIALADFNHDKKMDIAVADAVGNQIEMMLGNGDGTFQPPSSYPGGDYPVSIAATDFNHDGVLDAVVVQGHLNSIAVLLGLPAGGFAAPVSYPLPAVSQNSELVSADFNGDGNADVAVGNAGVATGPGHTVTVFLGVGDGTLGPGSDYEIGQQPFEITVADFNRDGKKDLATANFLDGTASVLIGIGDGTFQPRVDYQAGVPFGPIGIAPVKFGPKENVGLAVSGNTGTYILVGNGDGTFASGGSYEPQVTTVAAGNFTKGKLMDIAAIDRTHNQVDILLGKGQGVFAAPHDFFTGQRPNDAAQGDFNGDGFPDVVTANPDGLGDVSLFLGKGDGTFEPTESIDGGFVPGGVAVGDLNKDGRPDILVVNEISPDGTVTVLLGNGRGKFQKGQTYNTGDLSFSASLADLNGDGKLDALVANLFGNTVSVLLGNGDGTFQPAVNYAAGTSPAAVVAFDFNGDSKPDLAVADRADTANGIGTVSLLLGTGDGTFQPTTAISCGSLPNSIAVGDFNRDGKLDMATANTGRNNVTVLLSNGDGTFQSPVEFSVGHGNSAPWRVSSADFNDDGNLDLATANAGDALSNTVSVLRGDGTGGFSSPSRFIAGLDAHTVVVGDYDLDGKPDLAVANSLENSLSILLNVYGPGAAPWR